MSQIRALSRWSKIGLGLVGFLLVAWIVNAWLPGGGTKHEAQARPAQAHPRVRTRPKAPAVKWGGITKAQALAFAHADEPKMDKPGTDTEAVLGTVASYTRVRCSGRPFWMLDFPHAHSQWFESRAEGTLDCTDNGANLPLLTVRHGARR
jgi:hypothetical protein